MRYTPSQQELQEIGVMAPPQRLQYFLSRVIEAEEIWGLADPQGWVMREEGDKLILPIWPYQQCANDCVNARDLQPHATSLDHFVERILHTLIEEGIHLEVLPTRNVGGALVTAIELQSLFQSLLESGEYFLEG